MKTCVKIWAAIAVATFCMASCAKVNLINENTNAPEPDFYIVNLGMTGEIIEVLESPLTRAKENTDLYGIQVYSTPNKETADGQNVTWTRFAYGVFDSPDSISIKLLKGYRYKFEATMIVDGQNKVSGSISSGYSFPFYTSGNQTGSSKPDKQFVYQANTYLGYVAKGTTSMRGPQYVVYDHPNTERFYGEHVDYIPGKHGSKAMIKMKRVSFGAKFIAKGKLAKEGTLEILMNDAPKVLIDLSVSDKSTSDIYTFKNLAPAYADNDYTETISTTINWNKDDGTVFPLGTHDITFKRNKMSTVQVSIETDGADGEIGFEIDDTPMSEDDEVTNIEDGEIVDTEVKPNA